MTTLQRPEVLHGVTIKVAAPEGKVYITINEHEGKAVEVKVTIGKGGTMLAAWADALARVITLGLHSDLDIHSMLAEISGITSDRARRDLKGVTIRSGPEAVAYAIMAYLRDKNARTAKEFRHDDAMENGSIDEG